VQKEGMAGKLETAALSESGCRRGRSHLPESVRFLPVGMNGRLTAVLAPRHGPGCDDSDFAAVFHGFWLSAAAKADVILVTVVVGLGFRRDDFRGALEFVSGSGKMSRGRVPGL